MNDALKYQQSLTEKRKKNNTNNQKEPTKISKIDNEERGY